jgi:hypothetical protein
MYLYQSNSSSHHQNEIGGHKSAQIVSEKEKNKEVRKNDKTSNN